MKKELSPGAIIGIAAVAVLLLAGFGFFYMNNASGAAEDKAIEKVLADSAKKEYGGYTNQGNANEAAPAQSGPPGSGEGDAQAAYPGGKPAGQ